MKSLVWSLAALSCSFLQACHKVTPAAFWQDFSTRNIVANLSDQGPYGGHRALCWKYSQPNSFSTNSVLDFAKQNGWIVQDSIRFDSQKLTAWTYNGRPIFPLGFSGLEISGNDNLTYSYFPRQIDSEATVYEFKTGWVTVVPGTGKVNDKNGFVMMNKARSVMTVYHLWGE